MLPEDDLQTWHRSVHSINSLRPLILQKGGETRFQSVKNGLQKIEDDGLVAIHDGVRPLVSEDIIATSFRLAAIHQSAIAAMPSEGIDPNDGSRQYPGCRSFEIQINSDASDV